MMGKESRIIALLLEKELEILTAPTLTAPTLTSRLLHHDSYILKKPTVTPRDEHRSQIEYVTR